jgi:hypothetical protein
MAARRRGLTATGITAVSHGRIELDRWHDGEREAAVRFAPLRCLFSRRRFRGCRGFV